MDAALLKSPGQDLESPVLVKGESSNGGCIQTNESSVSRLPIHFNKATALEMWVSSKILKRTETATEYLYISKSQTLEFQADVSLSYCFFFLDTLLLSV